MAKITFITQEDEKIVTEGDSGSVMELAVAHNIKGIDGDCGGVCSCATCHVHVAPEFFDKLAAASEIEKDMLEFDDNADAYSRLACQLQVNESLNGIVLRVAGM
ncbi:MAG: 2Fe-2S iron-sulfur cluster-binding protein [Bacteroidota bacterium]